MENSKHRQKPAKRGQKTELLRKSDNCIIFLKIQYFIKEMGFPYIQIGGIILLVDSANQNRATATLNILRPFLAKYVNTNEQGQLIYERM